MLFHAHFFLTPTKKTLAQMERRGKKKNPKVEVKKRSYRVKVLTNDGELSKAFATMVQRGVAPSTDDIIAQLTTKFPTRKRRVQWPEKERIYELRNLVEKIVIEMDVDECMEECKEEEQKSAAVNTDPLLSESLRELQDSIENNFEAVQVQWEDIVTVASRAKKSTGGGLCQLTPWHLRSAVLNSAGNKCAKILAQWANRWAGGDFDTNLGAVLAMSRLIPIYKDWETDVVRPVACESAIRESWEELLRRKFDGGLKV